MKFKFLSLVLVLLLLPGAMVISACGKGDGYNLANLSTDFYSIAATENDNIVKRNNKIVFNYSHHVYNSKAFVTEAINSIPVYQNLVKYNNLFENQMSFSYEYIDECSNDIEIDESLANNLENSLFTIVGHSYEFEVKNDWDKIENLLKYLSSNKDILVTTLEEAINNIY